MALSIATRTDADCDTIHLTEEGLGLEAVARLARFEAKLVLSDAVLEKIRQANDFLARLIDQRRRVYGVTTGYGPLADNYVVPEETEALQRNLVYHLASGVGEPFAPEEARAILIARLCALIQGHSGASEALVTLMTAVVNGPMAPVIPEKGTVGASGDLTPLSHLALALMGEGAFLVDGQTVKADKALRSADLQPYRLRHKDAIALVNGTSAMTGLAALNQSHMDRLTQAALRLSVITGEVLEGLRSAWNPRIAAVRPHPGQIRASKMLWKLSQGSGRLREDSDLPPTLPDSPDPVLHDQAMPQDPYTLRCAPQAIGACLDVSDWHRQVVTTELNATTDNPLLYPAQEAVSHAGNFFGQHVAYASDALSNAIIGLAVHSERKIARLCDPTLNGGLPAFLQARDTGLHSGFMGAQVTASALLGEMRTHAAPASIQSIPTNNNNQDIVTMGTIAARRARDLLRDAARILAIEALVTAQALEIQGGPEGAGFARASQNMARFVREHVAFLDEDRPLSTDIELIADRLLQGALCEPA